MVFLQLKARQWYKCFWKKSAEKKNKINNVANTLIWPILNNLLNNFFSSLSWEINKKGLLYVLETPRTWPFVYQSWSFCCGKQTNTTMVIVSLKQKRQSDLQWRFSVVLYVQKLWWCELVICLRLYFWLVGLVRSA